MIKIQLASICKAAYAAMVLSVGSPHLMSFKELSSSSNPIVSPAPFIANVSIKSHNMLEDVNRFSQHDKLFRNAISTFSDYTMNNNEFLTNILSNKSTKNINNRRKSRSHKAAANLLYNNNKTEKRQNDHESSLVPKHSHKVIPITTVSSVTSLGTEYMEKNSANIYNFNENLSSEIYSDLPSHISEKYKDSIIDRQEFAVPEFPFYIRIWASVALTVVAIIGVLGNSVVPLLVCLNKDLRHSTNLFLLNLAAADLLVLLVCLPTAMVELHTLPDTWILGHAMCWLVPLIEVLVTRASVLTLVVISFERYLAICRPLRTASICSKPRASMVCVGLWVLALLSSIPTLLATEFMEKKYYDGSIVEMCLTGLDNDWVISYYIASAVVFVALPFVLLLVIYTIIAIRLLMQRPHTPPRYLAMQQWKAKKQVALMLGVVVVVFFICLLPFQIFTVWIIVSSEETISNVNVEIYYNFLYFCRLLVYINSAVNPVIYNVMSSKFRNALYKLLGKELPKGSTRKSLRRQSTMTTSLSSSSFVSLRRRASQVLSRTLSRKFEFKANHDTEASQNRTSIPNNKPSLGVNLDDIQNHNFDSNNIQGPNIAERESLLSKKSCSENCSEYFQNPVPDGIGSCNNCVNNRKIPLSTEMNTIIIESDNYNKLVNNIHKVSQKNNLKFDNRNKSSMRCESSGGIDNQPLLETKDLSTSIKTVASKTSLASSCSSDVPIVVQIVEHSSPMLPRYPVPKRPPRGRKSRLRSKSCDGAVRHERTPIHLHNNSKLSKFGKPPPSPRTTQLVKKVSFQETSKCSDS